MLSIKKKQGRKGNKQGIVLVMVLFIFAIAIILLSCALMLTQGTRDRIYRRAEDNQARLTVTAVAESFAQAIYMGEISDEDLAKMADAGGNGTGAWKTISLTGANIPGLSGDSDNCTQFKVYREHGSSSDDIVAQFTTTIDDQTENVQIIFHETPPTPTPAPMGGHGNMVETDGPAEFSEMRVGVNAPAGVNPWDNMVLCRGDMNFSEGATSGGASVIASFGNVRLLDDAQYSTVAIYGSGNVGSSASHQFTLDNLFFYNDNSTEAWVADTVSWSPVTWGTEVYNGRPHANRHTEITSTVIDSTPGDGDAIQSLYNGIAGRLNTLHDTAYPSWTAEDLAALPTLESGTWKLNGSALTDVTSVSGDLNGTYYLGSGWGNGTQRFINVTGNTTIYVVDSVEIHGIVLCVKPGANLAIRILPGKNLTFKKCNGCNDNAGDFSSPFTGILATNGRFDEHGNLVSTDAGWPADQGTGVPRCEIFGYGSNTVELTGGHNTLDAYITLLPNPTQPGGTFKSHDNCSHYYGRMYVSNLDMTGNGENHTFPYCPAESSGGSPIEPFSVTYTRYRIVSFWYYA
ncbi:MAG: hypothetical protein J5685_10765 [Clostridiales bacterium]|nr:hypothetical protein [Clostridiales bacterium]